MLLVDGGKINTLIGPNKEVENLPGLKSDMAFDIFVLSRKLLVLKCVL